MPTTAAKPKKVTGSVTSTEPPPKRPVVICTAKRGVFFGYTSESSQAIIDRKTVILDKPRMAIYWSAGTKGPTGLAAIGPQKGSRISPAPADLAVNEITLVVGCTEAAAAKWEEAPWN